MTSPPAFGRQASCASTPPPSRAHTAPSSTPARRSPPPRPTNSHRTPSPGPVCRGQTSRPFSPSRWPRRDRHGTSTGRAGSSDPSGPTGPPGQTVRSTPAPTTCPGARRVRPSSAHTIASALSRSSRQAWMPWPSRPSRRRGSWRRLSQSSIRWARRRRRGSPSPLHRAAGRPARVSRSPISQRSRPPIQPPSQWASTAARPRTWRRH